VARCFEIRTGEVTMLTVRRIAMPSDIARRSPAQIPAHHGYPAPASSDVVGAFMDVLIVPD